MKKNNQIGLASAYWDAVYGEHPSLVKNENAYYSFPPVVDEEVEDHIFQHDLPLIPCVDGHNVMTETTVSGHLDIDIKFCLSPNFVRDIAGRIIYIGYGPERKDANQWRLNRHVSFPRNCRPVTENIEGHELIENVLFTRFRCLESSTHYENLNHVVKLSYPAANLYPYKIRLDSFYQDGWRLPQTEMLYVNMYANATKANKYGHDILAIWDQMQNDGFTYADFYEKLQNSGALEKMFVEGCTLIPTTEAHNGYYDIADDFSILHRRAGRAVEGLHDIMDYKTSLEPRGTILEVIEPGYMTPDSIRLAKVIVSDGERYDIEHKAKGTPLYPDLKLPHTQCCAQWGTTWIPTQPHHFSAPAIWSWGNQTGHFLQMSGPLWDPLHYYYSCTDTIIQAFKNNMLEDSRTLAYIPKEMKKRFYPVVPMRGFDTLSFTAKQKVTENETRPNTGLVRIQDREPHCNIGYHPLPVNFEYALGYWAFPELMPQVRVKTTPSAHLKLAPVITATTRVQTYRNNAQDINEFERLSMASMTKEATGNPLEDYPQLHRYLSPYNANMAKNLSTLASCFAESASEPSETLLELSEEIGLPFYKEVYEMRQKAVIGLKSRNDIFDNHPDDYIKMNWTTKKEPV